MVVAIIGAFILGIVIWGLGSVLDPAPDNSRARIAGFVVFLLLTALILLNHYGASLGIN